MIKNYLNKKYDWEKRLKWDVQIKGNDVFSKCNQKTDEIIVKECLVEKNIKLYKIIGFNNGSSFKNNKLILKYLSQLLKSAFLPQLFVLLLDTLLHISCRSYPESGQISV